MSDRSRKFVCSAAALSALLAAASAHAQTAPAAEAKSPHTLTANVGLFSQYIFRGLTQTNRKPALQGGFDYSHASGFYAGVWGSNVSWVADTAETVGVPGLSSSLELDFYGGFKNTIGDSDFGYDVGILQYWYPGSYPSGWVKPNTTELYGALSWKWLTFKASYSLGDTFGVDDAQGTMYYDLTAAFPVTDKFTLIGHVGYQDYRGSINGVSNDDLFTYTDWKLEAVYAFDGGWSVGAAYTDTNAEDAGYTLLGRNIGKATGYVYVKKTF
jgi:uncharacterized protein (TIGR02001 family)